MTKPISETFAEELFKAHPEVVGLPFLWTSDGVFNFDPSMTKQQTDAVLAVYEAHDPEAAPPKVEKPIDLGSILTKDDLVALLKPLPPARSAKIIGALGFNGE